MANTQENISAQELALILSHPDHVAAMGNAVRVFLWLWGRADLEGLCGEVGNHRPLKVRDIARDLGLSQAAIKRDLARLEENDYIDRAQEQFGFSAFIQIDYPTNLLPASSNMSQLKVSQLKYEPAESPASSNMSQLKLKKTISPPNNPPIRNKDLLREDYKEPATIRNTDALRNHRQPDKEQRPIAVVADQNKVTRFQQVTRAEFAIEEIEKIPEFERPDWTETLRLILTSLSKYQIKQVFDNIWEKKRFRKGDMTNPPGWWAHNLRAEAELCSKLTKENKDKQLNS